MYFHRSVTWTIMCFQILNPQYENSYFPILFQASHLSEKPKIIKSNVIFYNISFCSVLFLFLRLKAFYWLHIKTCISLHSRHLFFQSQHLKQQKCVKFVQSLRKGYQNKVNHVILVYILLTLNRIHTLFWCFLCWFWTSKCRLGSNSETAG